MKRAQARNLSVVRILDPSGCVVASSTGWVGRNYADSPEVARALGGRYGYALRLRKPGKLPPLGSVSRRGRSRVFTALPVFADKRLIGVVGASRTGLDPISRLFQQRRSYLSLAAISIFGIFILVFAASAFIVRPIRSLTQHARRLKAGSQKERWKPSFMAPKETVILGEVLDDASTAIRDRADAVADFARHVSHELKTPITAVRGAAELLRDDGADMTEAQRIRFAGNIVKDASRMSRLVGRLLQFARLDSPSAFDEPTALDIVEAAGEAAIRNERIVLSVVGEPRPLLLNPDHFESMVGNLLDNALTYGEGRVDLHIEFETDGVRIEVSDEGPGIPDNHIEKVCEPFFTTSRNEGGTGLGLSIVRAIVEGLSGQLAISSSDAGAVVRISLPYEQSQS
jgi:signal transduction histidine kinase